MGYDLLCIYSTVYVLSFWCVIVNGYTTKLTLCVVCVGVVGEVGNVGDYGEDYFLWTKKKLDIGYNGNQVR